MEVKGHVYVYTQNAPNSKCLGLQNSMCLLVYIHVYVITRKHGNTLSYYVTCFEKRDLTEIFMNIEILAWIDS